MAILPERMLVRMRNARLNSRVFSALFDTGLRGRLVQGALGNGGIQAANRVIGLLLAVVLARSLGSQGYGIYAYSMAILSTLSIGVQAGIPTLVMRHVAVSESLSEWAQLRGIVSWACWCVGLLAFVVMAIGLIVVVILDPRLPAAVTDTHKLMLLTLPFLALGSTITHALKGLSRIIIAQALEVMTRPALACLFVATVFFLWPNTREPSTAMAAQLLGAAAAMAMGFWIFRRRLPLVGKRTLPHYRVSEWLRSATPFMLISFAHVINSNVDMFILAWFSSNSEVGLYRAAVQLAALVVFGLQAVNPVLAPHFARLYARGEVDRLQLLVTRSAQVIALSALPLAIVFIAFGGQITSWLFGDEFALAHAPLTILSIGQFANAAMGSVGFLMKMTGNERGAAKILMVAVLINMVLGLCLVPSLGMKGAAFASAASLTFQNIAMMRSVKTTIGIRSTPV